MVATPPSPVYPAVPVPAIVVIFSCGPHQSSGLHYSLNKRCKYYFPHQYEKHSKDPQKGRAEVSGTIVTAIPSYASACNGVNNTVGNFPDNLSYPYQRYKYFHFRLPQSLAAPFNLAAMAGPLSPLYPGLPAPAQQL